MKKTKPPELSGGFYYIQIFILIFIASVSNISNLYASGVFPLDSINRTVIGINQTHVIKGKETLIEIARRYDIGFNEIIAANSDIDPWIPGENTRILIPTSWIIPEIMDEGILVNLAEMRLYHFFTINQKRYVRTYPVGIGRQGFNTPLGTFRIITKVKDPVWHVPESIRREHPELPPSIPPGPDNPLGGYWLQLSVDGYGLHSTNMPYGIGRRVSHGCIRLYPEDMEVLFRSIKKGTPVRIVDEPVKIGLYRDDIYIEVHPSDRSRSELIRLAVEKLSRKGLLGRVNTRSLFHALKRATGLPTIISR